MMLLCMYEFCSIIPCKNRIFSNIFVMQIRLTHSHLVEREGFLDSSSKKLLLPRGKDEEECGGQCMPKYFLLPFLCTGQRMKSLVSSPLNLFTFHSHLYERYLKF
jgi:hypothetical protein